YEALSRDNPGLVMLSSCNQGQTGPHAAHPGYGSQLTALAGFLHLLGEPDRTPVLIYGPYIDYIAVGYGVIALLAALSRRKRTGPQLAEHIANWTRGRDRDAVVALLRDAGLRAAPVLTMGELFTDPQLRHRQAWVELEHPVLSLHGLSAPWTLSATPQRLTTA